MGIGLILGEPKEDDDEPADDERMSSDDHEKAKQEAADEVFDCLKKGDRVGFAKALAAHHDLHAHGPKAEDEGDEDDDHDVEDDEDDDEHGGLRLG